MSAASIRVVTRGPVAVDDEVWVDGAMLPGVVEWAIESGYGELRKVTVTFLADPLVIEQAGEPRTGHDGNGPEEAGETK